jgi:type II secretory pathway component PulF
MPKFHISATDSKGQKRTGTVTATSEVEVKAGLAKRGLTASKITRIESRNESHAQVSPSALRKAIEDLGSSDTDNEPSYQPLEHPRKMNCNVTGISRYDDDTDTSPDRLVRDPITIRFLTVVGVIVVAIALLMLVYKIGYVWGGVLRIRG